MAEDPLECSLLTLDLGNEDVCISTGSSGLFAEVADPMFHTSSSGLTEKSTM